MNAPEAQRWLRYAHEDWLAAQSMVGNEAAYPRHACWLAQQAAEKALKAALILMEIEFPFSHDLDRLRDLLPNDWQAKVTHPDLADLTEWAVEARYPGDAPEAIESDARVAVQQARRVWESIASDLANRIEELNNGMRS